MGSYHLKVMGGLELRRSGGEAVDLPRGKPFALLAHLATDPTPRSRDHLAGLLWPSSMRRRARASVRQALWVLRRELDPEIFEDDDPVALRPGRVTTDLAELESALERGDLDRAAELRQGPPFAGLEIPGAPEWERWSEDVRHRIDREMARAFGRRAREAVRAGEYAEAVRRFRVVVEVQPERLDARMGLVDALLRSGELEEAGAALSTARFELEDHPRIERLTSLEARLETLRREDRILTASGIGLAGRKKAVRTLAGGWWRAVEGLSTSIVVTGPEGVGKSRLLEEATRIAQAESGRLVAAEGCDGEGAVPWSMACDLIRRLLDMSGAAGVSAASDRLLRTLVPSHADDRHPAPGASFPAEAALLDAFHDLVDAVARDGPLLLCVDGFQWADRESRILLSGLGGRLVDEPVLLLVACRTPLPDSGIEKSLDLLAPPSGDREGSYRIELGPLSGEDVREFLELRGEEPRAARVERLHRLSAGNPGVLLRIVEEGEEAIAVGGPARDGERGAVSQAAGTGDAEWGQRSPAHRVGREGAQGDSGKRERRGGREGAGAEGDRRMRLREPGWLTEDARRGRGAPPGGRPVLRGRWRWIGSAAVLAGLAGGAALFGRGTTAEEPPYGGGTIYLNSGNDVLALVPAPGDPAHWSFEPLQNRPAGGPGLIGPYRGADGDLLWFERMQSERHPPWINRVLEDGTREVVARDDQADQFLVDVSPDGRKILLVEQDPESDRYNLDLHVVDLEAGERRALARAPRPDARITQSTRWHPLGPAVAALVRAHTDTLAVMSPSGVRLSALPLDGRNSFAWCGGSDTVAVLRHSAAEEAVHLLSVETWEGRVLDAPGPAWGAEACSPDGRALIYRAAVGGQPEMVLHDLDTDEHHFLPVGALPSRFQLHWLRDQPRPMPTSLRIAANRDRVQWGERLDLELRVGLSSGAAVRIPWTWALHPWWEWVSLDPDVLKVDASGVIHANLPGVGRVAVSAFGWLGDTITVTVEAGEVRPPTLSERFEELSPERWFLIGHPVPEPDTVEGHPALALRGDGRHDDGILLREPLMFPVSATVEAEFRLPVTRDHHQSVDFCLLEAEPPERRDRMHELGAWYLEQRACFRYPASELMAFDPSEVQLHVGGSEPLIRRALPDHLPTDDWFSVAIQMRADGEVSLLVEGEEVGRHPIHLRNGPDTRWRIGIFGHAVETEAHVRNLVLQPGLRYPRSTPRLAAEP